MYPLDVILIGADRSLLSQVREELLKRQSRIKWEQPDAATAVDLDRQAGEWTGGGDAEPLLVITHLTCSHELSGLRLLRRAFAGCPILVLLEDGNDPTALITAMREGATQVVPLPLQGTDFQAALDAVTQHYETSAKTSRVLAVSGVAGGCGASSLALNLAYELASDQQLRCLLVDLSLQLGMLASYLNIEPQVTIHDVLREISKHGLYAVQKGLIRIADKLQMIAGPCHAITPVKVQPQDVLETIRCCRRLAELVLLDVPCSYDDLYFKILGRADLVILVAEQRVPSIRAAKLICDRLAGEGTFAPPHLVVNRYNPKLKGFTLTDLEKLLPVSRLSGIAADDAGMTAAVNEGRPLRNQSPLSPVLADIKLLAETLLGIEASARAETGDFNVFGRLVRALGLA